MVGDFFGLAWLLDPLVFVFFIITTFIITFVALKKLSFFSCATHSFILSLL